MPYTPCAQSWTSVPLTDMAVFQLRSGSQQRSRMESPHPSLLRRARSESAVPSLRTRREVWTVVLLRSGLVSSNVPPSPCGVMFSAGSDAPNTEFR